MSRAKRTTALTDQGFTLVELMLSMTIFIALMVLATMGFVGMSRTVQRGLIHKGLSEAVQLTTEELTIALRTASSMEPLKCTPGSTEQGCGSIANWHRLCAGFDRFMWQDDDDGPYGLYQDNKSCYQGVNVTGNDPDTIKLVNERYRVRRLEVVPSNVARLFQVRGAFSTVDDDAFTSDNPDTMACIGTAQSKTLANNCAIEKFDFIVSTRIKT
jgi:Tfp pilus assembly protein FimT